MKFNPPFFIIFHMNRYEKIPVLLIVWLFVLHIPFAYTQFCVTYDDVYGWDYAAYVHAAEYILNGDSPYNEALYLYPPPLAILMTPFCYLSREMGFFVWTVISLIAYIFAVVRPIQCGFKDNPSSLQ